MDQTITKRCAKCGITLGAENISCPICGGKLDMVGAGQTDPGQSAQPQQPYQQSQYGQSAQPQQPYEQTQYGQHAQPQQPYEQTQ